MKIKKRGLPPTMYGFPVAAPREGDAKAKNRGVAIIISILAVAMIMIFSSNMIVNSQVNLEMSMAHRDGLKSEYMAKSGFNLALFLLTGDFLYDIVLYSTTQVKPSDGPGDFWAMLNGLPIGGESLEMISSFKEDFDLSAVNDEETISQLRLFDGQFVLDVQDESSRINISRCHVDGRCSNTLAMLEALMSCPAEKEFLEKKGIVASEMAQRIKDWVDRDTKTVGSGFSTEDDPYEKKSPPYQAKNAPMETLSELKLIEGWDDQMHDVFSPYITIYPYFADQSAASVININTASRELLGCLLPSTAVDCRETFELKLAERQRDVTTLAANKDEVKKVLSDAFCHTDGSGEDQQKRSEWFTARSNVFRMKILGIVGMQERTLETVVERTIPDKAKNILGSYRVLYWRVI